MSETERLKERESAPRRTGGKTLRGRARRGAEGGAVATLVMTAYRLPVTRSLPPTAEFWSQFVSGDGPYDHPLIALALHALYGVLAGVGFALMASSRDPVRGESGVGPPSPAGEVSMTVWGLVYGLVLSAFGETVVLRAVLDVDPDDRFAFHVGHVLYGITLGAWVGTRTTD